MRNWITRFIREEEGVSAAEYALLLALIGVAMATAATLLGTNITAKIDEAADIIGIAS